MAQFTGVPADEMQEWANADLMAEARRRYAALGKPIPDDVPDFLAPVFLYHLEQAPVSYDWLLRQVLDMREGFPPTERAGRRKPSKGQP